MEFLMTYGWAILAAIIVIGILAIYFHPFQLYVEFTISKEECQIESVLRNREGYMGCYEGCSQGIFETALGMKLTKDVFSQSDWDNTFSNCKNYCELRFGDKETEVCKQVEVEEIEIKHSLCEDACGGAESCVAYCVEERNFDTDIIEKVSKEDLTRELLNENAECIECYYDYDNSVDADGYCEGKDWDFCNKWSLNEYTIKVNK